jgi:hypothetical protein
MLQKDGLASHINIGHIIDTIFCEIKDNNDLKIKSPATTTYGSFHQALPSNIKMHKFEFQAKEMLVFYAIQISFLQGVSLIEQSGNFKANITQKKKEKLLANKSENNSQSYLSLDPKEKMLSSLRMLSQSYRSPYYINCSMKVFTSISLLLFVLTGTLYKQLSTALCWLKIAR